MSNRLTTINFVRFTIKTKIFIGISILFIVFSWAKNVSAASLYFSPASGSYAVGKTFSVNVNVSSTDQAMNAASGVISFPPDKIEVVSLSKSGSIFNFWIQEPSFSNNNGVINFEGVVTNPGFTGSGGRIITINFRAKAVGQATLVFSSGSVLANDGKGTDILIALNNASFVFNSESAISQTTEVTKPSSTIGTPGAPVIFSPTHPDQEKWYNSNTAQFKWQVPKDVLAVRLLYDTKPNSQPTIVYTPAVAEKTINDLKDGVYYFHAQFKNKNGWGAIAHFGFKIDSQPPEPFTIKSVEGTETTNSQPMVLFNTTDALSGMGYYKVKVGDGNFVMVVPEGMEGGRYILPPQSPGNKTILVQAFDKAGNSTTAVTELVILSLEPPVITNYPKVIQKGEILTIEGQTKYPNSQINLWLQAEKNNTKSYVSRSDSDGKFTFIIKDELLGGAYTAYAEVIDSKGAKSGPSEKITFSVETGQFGFFTIVFLSRWCLALIAFIVFVLLFIIWYQRYKLNLLKIKLEEIKKEIHKVESEFRKTMDLLENDIYKQVKMLEKTRNKRQLTAEEEKLIKHLRKDLEDMGMLTRKEV